MSLSGNRDTDTLILQNLDDNSLMKMCVVNKNAAAICASDIFWTNRLIRRYGQEVLNQKFKPNLSKRDIYFYLTYPASQVCFSLRKKAIAKLVIEDLYSYSNGYIGEETERPKSLQDLLNYIFLKTTYTLMEKNGQNTDFIKSEMNKIRRRLPQKFLRITQDSYNITDKDVDGFINNALNRNASIETIKNMRWLLSEERLLTEEEIRLVYKIHQGFLTKHLPLTITWDEICTHPYFSRQDNDINKIREKAQEARQRRKM